MSYAGSVQRGWLLLITACWSGSSATPRSSGPDSPLVDSTRPTGTEPSTHGNGEPADPIAALPPRAALDGRLRVKPQDMCGGAAPPDTYVAPPLAPVPGEKLTVTRGDTYTAGAGVIELTTDADGLFSAKLPPGRYCITRQGRGARPTQGSQHVNLACLVGRWEKCDAVAEVPVKTRVLIDIFEPCSWSICYHGPPPP